MVKTMASYSSAPVPLVSGDHFVPAFVASSLPTTVSKFVSHAFWANQGQGGDVAALFGPAILLSIALYLPALYLLQNLVKGAKPRKLPIITFTWNSLLAILSVEGIRIMVSESPYMLLKWHVHEGSFSPGARFVIAAFSLTKVIEFFDSFLLVMRGRPLGFLHPYHHITVALYCWHAQYAAVSFAHLFVLMNLAVHSCMYSYFAIHTLMPYLPTGLQNFIKGRVRPVLTLLQVTQMIIGCALATLAVVFPQTVKDDIPMGSTPEVALRRTLYSSNDRLGFLWGQSIYDDISALEMHTVLNAKL
eukprot:GHVT01034109.1.p1 GENE.GHVT01034109.1~~GHVT01034109.1.p1  ORF type:complete len:303 (+),score=13.94 GHVT01034109.1:244-1152(+)